MKAAGLAIFLALVGTVALLFVALVPPALMGAMRDALVSSTGTLFLVAAVVIGLAAALGYARRRD